MAQRPHRPGSLATQISVATLGLVTVSVFVASVLALGGVYNMARQESSARVETFRDILDEDLSERFNVAEEVVDSIAEAMQTGGEVHMQETVRRSAARNTEYFDVIVLARESGSLLAASPPTLAPVDASGEPYFVPDTANMLVYTWDRAEGETGMGDVWLTRSVEVGEEGDEERFVLMGRLRTGFVGLLVNEIASSDDGRAAMVVTEDGVLVDAGEGSPEIDLAAVDFEPDAEDVQRGEATLRDETLGVLEGYYAGVEQTGDLGWRVLVLEPQNVALERTRMALLPAALTVALAVLATLVASLLFGRRLVAPLRLLEGWARKVASGAYIQPIHMGRDDEVGRLAAAFNAMAARLNTLQDLSQLLASSSELDQVLDGILSAMEHILGTGHAALFLLDVRGESLELVGASAPRAPARAIKVPVSSHSWVSQAFRSGKPVSFIVQSDSVSQDPALGLFGEAGVSSGLAVPLAIGHQPLGVALALSSERRVFTEAEMEMARSFSAQAAIAVQNSRLFEEERESRMGAEALREMAELLASPRSIRETLEAVGRIAADLLDMSGSMIVMPERDRRDLDMGLASDPEREGHYQELWERIAGAVEDGSMLESVLVPDLPADPLFATLAESHGVTSVVMIPMMQEERLRGVLVLESGESGRTYSSADLESAAATGKTIAIALETNYLFHQARRRAENLEMVFRISQAVGLSLQTAVVLNRVMDVVQKMLPGDGVTLMQLDPATGLMTTAMARGIIDRRVLYAEIEAGADVPGEVFDSRQPRRIDDLSDVGTPMAELLLSQGFRSWLCAPLLARGRSIGVLNVFSEESRTFSAEDVELISTFASQAALALDTAELFEQEHDLATVLQSSILPEVLPQFEWLEMRSAYEPAGSEAEIGGDYYDAFRARDGRVVLAIGDVCGKGVPAATKTSAIRYTLRGLVTAGLGPSAALRELNRVVAETGDIADIVTMWVGYIDSETGRLTYSNAGHPPVLLRFPDERGVKELGPTGPLLGAAVSAPFGRRSVTLEPGATLLLYTDGVTEARGAEGLFGEQRLKEALEPGGSPDEVVARVLDAVQGFSEGVRRDDVAMLAVRVLETGKTWA